MINIKHILRQLMSGIPTGKLLVLFIFSIVVSCSTYPLSKDYLNGLTIAKAESLLQKADDSTSFVLSDTLHEYQYHLLSYYPNPNGKNIQIKQYVWNKRNNKTIIWFHNVQGHWISFDNLIWNKNAVHF
jgi:hypothetical protein